METTQALTATAEAQDRAEYQKAYVNKKHDEFVVLLQNTLAIGDYEDLFFNFLKAMKSHTHWALYENYLLILQNTYDLLIEDIYTA